MEDNVTLYQKLDTLEALEWKRNSTFGNLDAIKMDSNFAMLMCSLVFAVSWVIYITYYNSRLVALIITKTMNRFFISEGYCKIGTYAP